MKKLLIIVLAQVICATTSISQIAINEDNSNPDASAILDLKSTNKGLLIPRVSLNDAATAEPITNPAEGLIIYNINGEEEKGIYYWTGSQWKLLSKAGSCDIYGNPAIVALGNSASSTVSVCEGSAFTLTSNTNNSWDNPTPTYDWTGPNSFSSTSATPGQVTASFSEATHAGEYTVTITNSVATGCSFSSTITVTGVSEAPGTPASITGNSNPCKNTTEAYSIDAVANASTYNWTVPSGATVTNGQGTTSISVDFGTTNGDVSVRSENGCGESAYLDLAITLTEPQSITSEPENLNMTGTLDGSFYLTATGTGLTYQWQENQSSDFVNITNGGVYSGATTNTLSISNGTGMDGYTYKCMVTGNGCSAISSDTVTLNWVDGPGEVYSDSTAEYWLDRNLGASQVATASDDHLAYGSLFQWGRAAEGHEVINWTSNTGSDGAEQTNETSTNATHATPNQSEDWDGNFILEDTSPYDWLTTPDNSLWQGVSGTNNPCPGGFRLPTEAELEAEYLSWSTNNSAGAFASPLKLVTAGDRNNSTGALENVGSYGKLWSSTISGSMSIYLYYFETFALTGGHYRASGHSVRCIKD